MEYFNPRPREEGDRVGMGLIKVNPSISIHALVKRATFYFGDAVYERYFNPRPREEGDHGNTTRNRKPKHFNPHPREEGDYMLAYRIYSGLIFQSTPS